MSQEYYNKVQEYYNYDSEGYGERFAENETLVKLRASFRDNTPIENAQNILEIGFGPGSDLCYFAQKYPDKQFFGIDVSDGMYHWASKQIKEKEIQNVTAAVGTLETIATVFPDQKFDLIYVYFGALNTVVDIEKTAGQLEAILSPNGQMLLTFVNKWFMMGVLKPLAKFRFGIAFKRLGNVWGGYSPQRYLESKCYSSRTIKKAFGRFDMLYKRGYSIVFPAWYENRLVVANPQRAEKLWQWDNKLQKTPLWNLGEYSLYHFKKKGQ